MRAQVKRIALLPWGDVIEDFLDPLHLSLEDFRDAVTGGWLFGYIEALKSSGIESTLFCWSRNVREVLHWQHGPTGAALCVLPETGLHRRLRNSRLRARNLAPYLSTPVCQFRKQLRRYQPQLLLCQEYESGRFDVSVALGRLIGLPVVGIFQGGNYRASRVEALFRPWSMRACSGVIVGPESERARIGREYGGIPLRVAPIFNPLDLSVWYPEDRASARRALGWDPEARIVIWHGRVEIRQKGLDVLLEAWPLVTAHVPARLVLIGSGPDDQQLAGVIAERNLAVSRRAEYILDRAEMRRYLSAADLYVFPSRHEGLAVAPLEAMACGLPVVAADITGVRDVLRDGPGSGGLIVPTEDPPALAAAIQSLLTSAEQRQELSRRARHRVESEFSLQVVGERLRDFLNRSLN